MYAHSSVYVCIYLFIVSLNHFFNLNVIYVHRKPGRHGFNGKRSGEREEQSLFERLFSRAVKLEVV